MKNFSRSNKKNAEETKDSATENSQEQGVTYNIDHSEVVATEDDGSVVGEQESLRLIAPVPYSQEIYDAALSDDSPGRHRSRGEEPAHALP